MKLSDRLRHGRSQQPISDPSQARSAGGQVPAVYEEIKTHIHAQLVDRLELSKLEALKPEELKVELRSTITSMMLSEQLPLNRAERDRLVQELLDEITGFGPLEPLLADNTISDILVNGADTIYIERSGKLDLCPIRFRDDAHLMQIINRIVSRVGRRVDETSPMVDARLPDGSRVNAIIPPLALDGPSMSIRRFGGKPLLVADLISHGAISKPMIDFLSAAVRARLNVLISGGTGTGKTTMLNALSSFIPSSERIITIEDAAELQLQQPHVVRLETRPPNVEGHGEVRMRDLVKNSLRMRPDRIIIGECRGGEVLDMLQAMNTGHEGSMTTIHANSPRDALTRMQAMVGMSGVNFSENLVRETIARAIDLLVQLNRGPDGRRRVISISEVTGTEGSVITLQDIFAFQQHGLDSQGNVVGDQAATGVRPQCMDRIRRAGFKVHDMSFQP